MLLECESVIYNLQDERELKTNYFKSKNVWNYNQDFQEGILS
jgi:hypothetical protein